MKAAKIPVDEISFHPTSFCDRDGRLFWWKGELYRGITEAYADLCKRLFEDGIVQRLMEKSFLVETDLTNLSLDGYPLVLKHRSVPFVSYANEWCPEMLRDAGLLITDMMIELAGDNLILDVDTWDILFDGCQPVYVDFCSIMAGDSFDKNRLNALQDDFRSYFIYPLQLMTQGNGNLARWLLADYPHEAIHAELASLMGHKIYRFRTNHGSKEWLSVPGRSLPHPLRSAAHKGLKLIQSALPNLPKFVSDSARYGCDLVQRLRQELESIPMPSTHTREDDEEDQYPSLTPSDEWTPKHRFVHGILSDLCPSTVLDIGTGRGWYSQLAASLGSRVVALDVDDRRVGYCYQEARKKNLLILPLVMDIGYPSPGHGISNQVIAPALQRLPCEMVLALSLVHFLVFDQDLTFEQICQTLASFSKRWLVVEFYTKEDLEVSERWSNWYSWYRLEKFLDVLGNQFRQVSTMPSHPESRVLLLCEK
jgi:hypothetical protein